MLHSFKSNQRGDMLLEALVGVLITAIMGAGLAHVVAQTNKAQHDTAVAGLVVNEARNVMQASGVAICADGSLAAQKKGLPSALKSQINVVSSCEAAAASTVGMGGLSFPGTLPGVITLSVTRGSEAALEVRSAVPPDEDAP